MIKINFTLQEFEIMRDVVHSSYMENAIIKESDGECVRSIQKKFQDKVEIEEAKKEFIKALAQENGPQFENGEA